MSTQIDINKLHSLELKIAKEVKRVCDKNNIDYFLIAGTLLGAIRHKGFIPWDDDMDIGMLRKDYDKFIEVCKTDLSEEFFLQTWDSDPNYPFSYGKVRLNKTHISETFAIGADIHDGIFIDVFPFDNVPLKEKQIASQRKKSFIYKRILWIKKGFGKSIKNSSPLKYMCFNLFSKLLRYNKMKERYKKLLIKFNNIESDLVVTDGSYDYSKETIKKTYFLEKTEVNFENDKFTTFKDYENYLSYFYGDYMKLPPIEKRKTHGIINIDFGEY